METAKTELVSLYSEEAIEEGEIVKESTHHLVIKACRQIMGEILTPLHAAASVSHLMPRGGVAPIGGRDLEFAVGLQEGMTMWCERLLELLQEPGGDEPW